MDEEFNDAKDTVEAPVEGKASPLAEVAELVATAEMAITDGSKTKNEAIDELVASLEGMKDKGAEPKVMGGMGADEAFPLPEPEE